MASASYVHLMLSLQAPDLDAEEVQKETERLLQQLRQLDEVEDVNLVRDPNPPEQSKPLFGTLLGVLSAEVSVKNIKAVIGFLGDRLSNKTIELEVEANGKKLSVKASSQEELKIALKAAQEFIAAA